jgi:hypothetical protein
MADIVFTYAPADTSRAHAIAEALKEHGVDVEWDRTLLPGERYDAVITRRLNEAKGVVVLWSGASIGSNIIIDEAGMARDQGKLIPVRIDAVDAPMGFRQLQTADLAGFPASVSPAGIKSLADALKHAATAPLAPSAMPTWQKDQAARPTPARRDASQVRDEGPLPKLFNKSFLGWTGAIATFSGLMFFLSPEGQKVMQDDVAQRTGVLIGTLITPILVFGGARVLVYWSRRWVGKHPKSYFSIEWLWVAGVGVLLGLMNAISPQGAPQGGGGVIGLIHQFNFAVIGSFMIFTPLIFLVRGIIRLAKGKPKGPVPDAASHF